MHKNWELNPVPTLEGARQKFEDICYDVYASEFPNADVHQVEVVLGDGGVNIDIIEENGDSTIVQCKFFWIA